ncbi:MarR family winged helix-turn-helix transcriptional regulator [Clostridiisalibacter paucivorans]|uniref:MarR family winged helix-turn-helix transcriptional regulator n=1 Tax=Clostridiisalibacter paucivorans TaxID=408753 RepID=UPI00047AD360|nr:MarR family transcriptional regulator [Clostridiisalibacter paucivorans]
MENIYEELGRWISILYRQFQIYINNELKDLDIKSGEYIYLIKLYEDQELTQEDLAKIYYIDKAAITRSIKGLEDKGYIKRTRNERDKRSYSIKVTEKALRVKKRIYNALKDWDDLIASDVKDEDLKYMSNKLKEMSIKALSRDQ